MPTLRCNLLASLVLTMAPMLLFAGPIFAQCSVEPGNIVHLEQPTSSYPGQGCNCPGCDEGARVQMAVTALNGQSGTIDARGLAQPNASIHAPITLGSDTPPQSVTLLLGPGNWYLCASITLMGASSIQGFPMGMNYANTIGAPSPFDPRVTNLRAGANFCPSGGVTLPSMINIGDGIGGGTGAVVQDVALDGRWNASPNGTALGTGAGILVKAGFVELLRVRVHDSGGDGIRFEAPPCSGVPNSCGAPSVGSAKLVRVESMSNVGAGLYLKGHHDPANAHKNNLVNDVTASESWFEANGGNGIKLEHAQAFRINNSDVSGSGTLGWLVPPHRFLSGILLTGASAGALITSTQFGDNWGNDIEVAGIAGVTPTPNGTLIANNQFIGSNPTHRPFGQYDAIKVSIAGGHSVTGNVIRMGGLLTGIELANTASDSLIMANTFLDLSASSPLQTPVFFTGPGPGKPFPLAVNTSNMVQ
jgi:hypothetical protein